MAIKQKLVESSVTDPKVFFNRRQFLTLGAATSMGMSLGFEKAHGFWGNSSSVDVQTAWREDPSQDLYPVTRNPVFNKFTDEVTDEAIAAQYNNFYEFGSHKQIAASAQALQIRPWVISVDGEVERPMQFDIDDLLKSMPLEERIYRHRCVEAWSMVVPWSGFPLHALLRKVNPTSRAKFVRFESFLDTKNAPGQRQSWYPWPYVEGLTIAEATHDLTFMATGIFGHPLPKQHGAPMRLALPWKYGFKSSKSIVKITLTEQRPVSFWEEIQPKEYGFWANVNPGVPHPRWPQRTEQVLGTGTFRNTEIFNGYGEEVAGLYPNLSDMALYR
ncbi:MAG: protein-methionine-sulfoxide reductase catalytic subunit MsrP [Alphaproteobacteria bacterium]